MDLSAATHMFVGDFGVERILCSPSSGMTMSSTVVAAVFGICVKFLTAASTPPPTSPSFACASSPGSTPHCSTHPLCLMVVVPLSSHLCGCSRWFRLFSELLQLFQWLYLTQPSSLSAVAQHLVVNLQEAIIAGRRTGKPLASLNTLWEGLQSAAAPRIPPFLCFSKERMLLLSTDDNLGFEQVSLLPLLSRLDHHSLITLFSAMLCERHIAFVSRHLPTLSSCLQAAVSLLYPFKWQVCEGVRVAVSVGGLFFMFTQQIMIPIVPHELLAYCAAPSPWIVGLRPSEYEALQEFAVKDVRFGLFCDFSYPWNVATCNRPFIFQIVVVNLDQGYITVLNDENGIPDVTGCHPRASARGIFYSGPDQSLLEIDATVTINTKVGGSGRKSIGPGANAANPLHIGDRASGTLASTLDSLQPTMQMMLQRGGVIGNGDARDAFSYPTTQLGTFHASSTGLAYSKEAISTRLARRLYYNVLGSTEMAYTKRMTKR